MLHTDTRTEYVGFETERRRERAAAREAMIDDREEARAIADEVRLTDLVRSAMELGAASARYAWNLASWPMRSAMSMMNNGRKV
jgi:hypothetical protein